MERARPDRFERLLTRLSNLVQELVLEVVL